MSNYNYFQVVISGHLSISFIHDDGSAYSLSNGGKNYIIGEMDLFVAGNDNVLAEAISSLLTIAIDTIQYKDKLLHNIAFLQLMATTLANKISAMTNADAAPSSLSERILNYMKFKCDNHIKFLFLQKKRTVSRIKQTSSSRNHIKLIICLLLSGMMNKQETDAINDDSWSQGSAI